MLTLVTDVIISQQSRLEECCDFDLPRDLDLYSLIWYSVGGISDDVHGKVRRFIQKNVGDL